MNAPSNENPVPFIFNSLLDSEMLESLYENDIAYAQEVFAGFLSETTNSLSQINQYFSEGDLHGLRRVFHKIKPTFSLVGLTPLTHQCEAFIVCCDRCEAARDVADEFDEITRTINRSLPIIHEEITRMKNYSA